MEEIVNFDSAKSNIDNERKSKAKNIKVNKNSKAVLRRGVALVVAGTIAAGTLIGIFAHERKKDIEANRASIVTYYGEDSDEADILRYLDLAIKLDELDLDKYSVSKDLEYSLIIREELSRPAYIDAQIDEYRNMSINDTDLKSVYDGIQTIAFLKKQKELINEYISSKGHSIVYEDFRSSLKDYAAEEYNLDVPQNIIFNYNFNNSDGTTTVTLNYNENYREYRCVVNNRKIKNGVCDMVSLQNLQNSDSSNKKILNEYISALVKSMNYKNDVDEKDLYNPKSEERLKGR